MIHDRNPIFVRLSDGAIRNGYTVRVANKRAERREFTLTWNEAKDIDWGTILLFGTGIIFGSLLADTGLAFIVDPLDGTTNFLHGYPEYAVSIGVAREGELVSAVVVNVPTGERFTALAGSGASRLISGTKSNSPIGSARSKTSRATSRIQSSYLPTPRAENRFEQIALSCVCRGGSVSSIDFLISSCSSSSSSSETAPSSDENVSQSMWTAVRSS